MYVAVALPYPRDRGVTTKEMRDTQKVMYSNEKNPSRVFEIYELLFELK